MTCAWTKLTPVEAALVARVSVRDVNRLYDERMLPEELLRQSFSRENHDRYVWAWACTIIAFYFQMAHRLTKVERLKAIEAKAHDVGVVFSKFITIEKKVLRFSTLASPLKETKCCHNKEIWDQLLYEEAPLKIDWKPFVCNVEERLQKLFRAKSMVESFPEILGGIPVIAGTRVPVYDVAASVEKGVAIADILEAYPSISPEQVELAAFYAEAVPLRGRPKAKELPEGTKIIARHRVPRRSGAK